ETGSSTRLDVAAECLPTLERHGGKQRGREIIRLCFCGRPALQNLAESPKPIEKFVMARLPEGAVRGEIMSERLLDLAFDLRDERVKKRFILGIELAPRDGTL